MTIASAAASLASPAATGTTGAAAGGSAGIGQNFNTFLTLLTTQLKNQDPTKAMDTQQMTAQLVQFAQVEQSISMNTNMTKLIGLQQAAQLTAAAPLMGRMVEVATDQLPLQNGSATVRLPAAGNARDALVTVQDSAGRTVREVAVPLGASPADWVWDGRDTAGRQLPDGAYRLSVGGRDAGGGAQPVEATIRARATAAERQSSGDLRLVLGPVSVGFDAVRSLAGG